jgi:sugar phosphate isomerase/epimerase
MSDPIVNTARDRREVFVSTTSFKTHHLPEIFSICAQHDIGAVELSVAKSWTLDLLRKEKTVRRLLVHNYFPPPAEPFLLNLASQDPANLKRSLDHCRTAIDLSAELGGSIYAAHGGFGMDLGPALLGNPEAQAALSEDRFVPYERVFATLLDSVRTLCAYGREVGVRFLIENNVVSPLNGERGRRLIPMAHPQELLRLAQEVGDPDFGLLVDVGHTNVSANALHFDRHEFIALLAPHIVAFHLSENNGLLDQNRSFGKEAWFVPYLRDFPDAMLTLELNSLTPQEILAARDVVMESI